jgi:hypothetical protein
LENLTAFLKIFLACRHVPDNPASPGAITPQKVRGFLKPEKRRISGGRTHGLLPTLAKGGGHYQNIP